MDGYGARVARMRRGWLVSREPIWRTPETRQFVDDILRQLADSDFGASAWGRFLARSLARSVEQARIRPVAAAEVTAIHLLAGLIGSRWWTAVSWLLCITHLGLLDGRSTLGWPNRLTLLRALLPVFAADSRWTSLAALASDFADGRIARRGAETPFGAFADPIADGVFWSWYALRWERNRWLRWVPLSVFATAIAAIATAYFARARAIDYPRPNTVRYASGAAQIALTLRALRGDHRPG